MEAIQPMCEGMDRCKPDLDLQAELKVYARADGGADIWITGSRRNIRGVLIYAETNSGERVGTFDIGPDAGAIGTRLQYMDCGGNSNPAATVTHTSRLGARGGTGIWLHWNRPEVSYGDVTFRAAIACHRNHYAIAPHENSHTYDPDEPPVDIIDAPDSNIPEDNEEVIEDEEEPAVIDLPLPEVGAPAPPVSTEPFNWAFVVAAAGFSSICLSAIFLVKTRLRTSKFGRAVLFTRPFGSMTVGQYLYLTMFFTTLTCFLLVYRQFANARDVPDASDAVHALTWSVTFIIASVPLPITRRSLWTLLFGSDFASSIFMRKYLMFAGAALSGILTALVWFRPLGQGNVFWGWNADGTAPFLAFTAAGALGLMCFLGRTVIQTRAFEVFNLTHHLMPLLWVLWGAYYRNLYHRAVLAVPLTVYLVDSAIRLAARCKPHFIVSADTNSGVLKLVLEANDLSFSAGQHVFLNCPSLAMFQWHAFNIASAPGSKEITLLIKDMGEGTWSNRLQSHFKAFPASKIYIDGPYGSVPMRMTDYKAAVLLSAGVGVARNFSIAAELLKFVETNKRLPGKLERVDFVWVTRLPDSFSWMPELLYALQNNPFFRVQLYCTRLGLGSAKVGDSARFSSSMRGPVDNASRPKVDDLFADVLSLDDDDASSNAGSHIDEADAEYSSSMKLLAKQEECDAMEVGLMVKGDHAAADETCMLASTPLDMAQELRVGCAERGIDYNFESYVL
jgi:hypothetical protein